MEYVYAALVLHSAGKKIDEKLAREAAKATLKNATPLALNGYKIPLFENVITRAILAANG